MKMYGQEFFNRHNTVSLLTALSHPGAQLYLAVDVLESMRVTSVDEAVKDKISIYDSYVNHTLKYAEIAKIHEIENIVKGFLSRHCAETSSLLEDNPDIPLDELMNQCHDSGIVTSAKCIFSFLYIVTVMRRVEVPSFQTLFSPYSLERFRGVDVLPLPSDDSGYYMYFQLDLQKTAEIIGTVMGAWSVHLCLTVGNVLQYYIRIIDEECLVVDYTDSGKTIDLLNGICKGESRLFEPCSSSASRYE